MEDTVLSIVHYGESTRVRLYHVLKIECSQTDQNGTTYDINEHRKYSMCIHISRRDPCVFRWFIGFTSINKLIEVRRSSFSASEICILEGKIEIDRSRI